jgi:hypothetical protein
MSIYMHTYCKNYTIIKQVRCTTYYGCCTCGQPTVIAVVLLKKDVGHPCRRPLFLFYEVLFPESFEVMECWSVEFVVSVFTAKSSPSGGLPIGVQLTLATA